MEGVRCSSPRGITHSLPCRQTKVGEGVSAGRWLKGPCFIRCGSKTHPCAKRVAEQTQTGLMEQAAVPTGVQRSGRGGVSPLQQLPACNTCVLG